MKDYLVIDLEMTGLHPKRDVILEVGAVKVRDHRIQETLEFFVNAGLSIPPEITELTGITQEMLNDGCTPEDAVRRVADFGGDDIWVGHNIIFDYSFLKQQAVNIRLPFEKMAVDTLRIARACMQQPESKSLESLCQYLNIDRAHKHRAVDDAVATYTLYEWMEERFLEENEKMFVPRPLCYKPKRESPATKTQKNHLKELADYHKINLDVSWDTLTRSEASRLTDRIISRYGRGPKGKARQR
ncbi:MAG: PolC-type DNA polymerase III [Roseburia sp.]